MQCLFNFKHYYFHTTNFHNCLHGIALRVGLDIIFLIDTGYHNNKLYQSRNVNSFFWFRMRMPLSSVSHCMTLACSLDWVRKSYSKYVTEFVYKGSRFMFWVWHINDRMEETDSILSTIRYVKKNNNSIFKFPLPALNSINQSSYL